MHNGMKKICRPVAKAGCLRRGRKVTPRHCCDHNVGHRYVSNNVES